MNDIEQSTKQLKAVYDDIVSGHREPITIFLQKEENAEKLTKLVIALNYFVAAMDVEEMSNRADKMTVARKAILSDLKRRALEKDVTVKPLDPINGHRWHKPQENYYSGSGSINCPVCNEGKLHYSRAGYNGHVHAQCSTNGCVAWME